MDFFYPAIGVSSMSIIIIFELFFYYYWNGTVRLDSTCNSFNFWPFTISLTFFVWLKIEQNAQNFIVALKMLSITAEDIEVHCLKKGRKYKSLVV